MGKGRAGPKFDHAQRKHRLAAWLPACCVAWLVAGVITCATAFGQAGAGQKMTSGSISGRLTDLQARPVAGATVIMRNEVTGAETRAVTGKNGAYRFAGLEPGAYIFEAISTQLGRGALDGIVISSGHEARVMAAVGFQPDAGEKAGTELAVAPILTAPPPPVVRMPLAPAPVLLIPSVARLVSHRCFRPAGDETGLQLL